MRDKSPDSGTTVPQWGDSRGKAQIGGQVVNVSATDARTDHSTHTHFLATSTGAASGVTKKDMVKAAIRPYSDVKYRTV
jgi:hypothetical protein